MLSIIIPTLEEEKVISGTLTALRSNFTLAHEIIVSDGGSKDRTVELARPLADRVVTPESPERQTISAGRNLGAAAASGDFFVFIDADCSIPQPDRFFARALHHFEVDSNLVALTACQRFTPDQETLADKLILGIQTIVVRANNNFFRKGDSMGGEFQMIRASAFRAVGGYREDLVTGEDRDLFRRLSKIGRTFFDSDLTVFHPGRRVHAVGWPRLILLFFINTLALHLRGRVLSKEWKPVR